MMIQTPTISIFLIITSFLLVHVILALQEEPSDLRQETTALQALKASLNDPSLNSAWNGPHCEADASKWFGIRCNPAGHVVGIVLESMGLEATLRVDVFAVFASLSVLSLRSNSLAGTPMGFASNHALTCLDLSRNLFSGEIPPSLVGIPGLQLLLLQENFLNGPIPEFDQVGLNEFNVSYNDLTGPIPRTTVLQSFSFDSYKGNPQLCGPPSLTTCVTVINSPGPVNSSVESTKQPSLMSSLKRYLLVFDLVLLLVLILLFGWYFKKARTLKKMMKEYDHDREDHPMIKITDQEEDLHRDNQTRSSSNSSDLTTINKKTSKKELTFVDDDVDHGDGEARVCSNFKMSDLLKASAEGLGNGAFGNCYKATMDGMAAVVVKKLRNAKPLTEAEFGTHLRLIGHQKHPNLLPLIAYCNDKDEKLLVYHYIEGGNLFDRIHGPRSVNGPSNRVPFLWSSRLAVARGITHALAHLHRSMASLPVPHGNLKSTNVLLGPNDTALVSDYGLVCLVALPMVAQCSASYRSPECKGPSAGAKRASRKSDVWSFGCLLLELLTGKVSAHTAPPGARGIHLAKWVHSAVREEWTAEIFDTEIFLNRRSAVPEALRLLEIAMRCVEKSPEKRPEMEEVAAWVEEIQSLADQSDPGDDGLSYDTSLSDESMSSAALGISRDRDLSTR